MILLAEEDASTILDAEKLFKQAYKYAEVQYKKSLTNHHLGTTQESVHSKSELSMGQVKHVEKTGSEHINPKASYINQKAILIQGLSILTQRISISTQKLSIFTQRLSILPQSYLY